MKNKILAIVGLPGAGKSQVIKYIVEKTHYPRVYFGDVTFDEMKKKGIKVNEANERKMRESIRAKYGMSAYAILNLPKIRTYISNSNVLVESLYSWEEYLTMKKEFGQRFKVLAVLSSPEKRINRITKRLIRPSSEKEVISRDYSQIENLHQAGPIARADYFIVNEGTKKDLRKKVDELLVRIF